MNVFPERSGDRAGGQGVADRGQQLGRAVRLAQEAQRPGQLGDVLGRVPGREQHPGVRRHPDQVAERVRREGPGNGRM